MYYKIEIKQHRHPTHPPEPQRRRIVGLRLTPSPFCASVPVASFVRLLHRSAGLLPACVNAISTLRLRTGGFVCSTP